MALSIVAYLMDKPNRLLAVDVRLSVAFVLNRIAVASKVLDLIG